MALSVIWKRLPREFAGCCLIVALAGWSYWSQARAVIDTFVSPRPQSYYGLLTEALACGQVSLKITPDPAFLALANPYAGPQGTSRPHDMSFYRGKFYVYYGITPALVLMLPWHVLTRTYLTEPFATALMAFGSFVLGAWWLATLKRRLFPHRSPLWLWGMLVVLAFGSPTFALACNPTFYAVPIAGACLCLALAMVCAQRAAMADHADASWRHIAAASFAYGLAVGARPDYVLGLPLLLIPAIACWLAVPNGSRWRWAGLRLFVAAIVPAALVGLGLATYNYARFDSPVDFGIQYSLASGDVRSMKLMGPEFIPKNLRLYLLRTGEYIRYFPFLSAGDQSIGLVMHLSLGACFLLFPFTLLVRRLRGSRAWVTGVVLIGGAACANLATLCLFFGGEGRYMADYTPPALLASCAVVFGLLELGPRWMRWAMSAAVVVVAGWTLGNGFFYALGQRPSTGLVALAERQSNRVVGAIEHLAGVEHGPIELTLRFPAGLIGQREPLLATGHLGHNGDIIYVEYTDAQHVRFGFFHLGAGGPIGAAIPLDYTAAHVVTLQLGSLFPPQRHPLLAEFDPTEIARLRRRLLVTLDAATVLEAAVDVYGSTPEGVKVGLNSLAPDVSHPRFTGTIAQVRRLPFSAPPPSSTTGPVRLTLTFQPEAGGPPQPLISTGVSGHGDLLSLELLPGNQIRFLHDNWGAAVFRSPIYSFTPQSIHELEVEMGSLAPASAPAASVPGRLVVRLDGTLLFDVDRPFTPAAPSTAEFGYNVIGASSATSMFTGAILKRERIATQPRAALTTYGAVALEAQLPAFVPGTTEPLIITGKLGAADVVFVHYDDAHHIRVGYDHWGYGGTMSAPIEIDYGHVVSIEVAHAALLPVASDPLWKTRSAAEIARQRGTLIVKINGHTALEVPLEAYPANGLLPVIGVNSVGASSCNERFTGQILSVRRLALP